MPWKCTFVLNGPFERIGYMEAYPECGEDFCDGCGDCLKCYGGEECVILGAHMWVKYVGSEEEARRIARKYGVRFIPMKEANHG